MYHCYKCCGYLLYRVHLSKLLIMCPFALAKQLKHNFNQVGLIRGPSEPGSEAPRSGVPMNSIPLRFPVLLLVCLIPCVALPEIQERSFSVDLWSVGGRSVGQSRCSNLNKTNARLLLDFTKMLWWDAPLTDRRTNWLHFQIQPNHPSNPNPMSSKLSWTVTQEITYCIFGEVQRIGFNSIK